MGISTLSRAITPKQPKTAGLVQTAVAGTWYTVVSVSSNRGILNRVAASFPATSNGNNIWLDMRITIDGTVNTFTSTATNNARGYNHADVTTANGASSNSFDYFCSTYFYSSLIVEVRMSTLGVGGSTLYGVADYSVE